MNYMLELIEDHKFSSKYSILRGIFMKWYLYRTVTTAVSISEC